MTGYVHDRVNTLHWFKLAYKNGATAASTGTNLQEKIPKIRVIRRYSAKCKTIPIQYISVYMAVLIKSQLLCHTTQST